MEKSKIKREIAAGGAVFKKEDGKILWLIVQPKRSKANSPIHWRLAKGLIEKDEPMEQTALREIEEEAGIKAKVLDKIGKTTYFYSFKKERIFKIIIFYLMEFLSQTGSKLDEVEIKKVEWLPYREAYEKLSFDSERKILEKAKKILEEKER